jgi:putative nucleotidyltransferase with HDIG domain
VIGATTAAGLALEELIESGRQSAATGEYEAALSAYEAAFRLIPSEGDARRAAQILRWIGTIHRERGDIEEARELYDASLEIARANQLTEDIASVYNCMAVVEQFSGGPDRAETLYREAKRVAVGIRSEPLIALIDNNLGMLANMRGDTPAALLNYTSALFRYQRLGNQSAATRALMNMGLSHLGLNELDAASACLDQAYEIANGCRDLYIMGFIQLNRAELYLKRQHYEEARQCCDDGFTIFTQLDSKTGLGEAYKFYGALYRETGKPHLADIHLSLALTLSKDASNVLLQAEVQHELARVHLEEHRNLEAIGCLNSAHKLFHAVQARREIMSIDKQLDELEGTYLKVVGRWGSEAIEAKDPYTLGHSERVATYAANLAETVGVSGRELTWLRIGGLLHDVGKTVVPASVLVKPGVLNESEWGMMKRHTIVGDEIVAGLNLPFDVRPMVRNHHERWDGQGYPERLAGADIPADARILAVADVWDALTTARSYRNAFPMAEARRILDHQAGRALDPQLVEAFQDVLITA